MASIIVFRKILFIYSIVPFSLLVCTCQSVNRNKSAQHDQTLVIVADIPGYPYIFELNAGQKHLVRRKVAGKMIERMLQVRSIKLFTEPNLWFDEPLYQQTYYHAEIAISVSGVDTVLIHRPYQMPVTVNGLRIYVEAIKEWAEKTQLADLTGMQNQLRLAVCAADELWGPVSFRFPVADYRWRSSAYNNTWTSLVPYNMAYYHHGEDYGAIPDKLAVVAPFDGTITQTPVPAGDGKSNAVFIRQPNGVTARISHMNTESLNPAFPAGSPVTAGTHLAKTGMTWDGRKSQHNDPHCHIELLIDSTKMATFPYLMEAYFRDYPDEVLAIAGGYRFTLPGKAITLDAGRSLTRPGAQIASYEWKLHNGETSNNPIIAIAYTQPGLYTEELTVTTTSGHQDKDFLQVRVFESTRGKNLAYGWVYHYPVRNTKAGTPVLFWNRLVNTTSPVIVDFGDGSHPEQVVDEIQHAFTKKGLYTVTFTSTGPVQEPVTLKMDVHIEKN